MVTFHLSSVSKIKTPFPSSPYRLSIQSSPTCIFIALFFYKRAWKRVGTVYGFDFHSDSSSLDYSSYWSRFKITCLRRAVLFPFDNYFCSMSSLKFGGIWSSHFGSLGLTFWLINQAPFLSYFVIFSNVLFSTVMKSPLNFIVSLLSTILSLISLWQRDLFLVIFFLKILHHIWLSVVIYYSDLYHLDFSF